MCVCVASVYCFCVLCVCVWNTAPIRYVVASTLSKGFIQQSRRNDVDACMSVCAYMCICVCVCAFAFVCVCVHVCVYGVYMHACVYVCSVMLCSMMLCYVLFCCAFLCFVSCFVICMLCLVLLHNVMQCMYAWMWVCKKHVRM